METWTISQDNPGYRSKIVKRDGYTIEVLRPILTEEEAAKREKHAKGMLEQALKNYIYKGRSSKT